MQSTVELEQENSQLKEALAARESQVDHLKSYVEQLEQALIVMRRHRFGPSSEKSSGQQVLIFNEAEASEPEAQNEADTESGAEEASDNVAVAGYSRSKKGRKPLPESLPRIDVVHDLPESEKRCAVHGVVLEAAGEKISEQLDIIPATVQVLRHIRKQYSCPCCENGMVTATKPTDPIPKSQASSGTLAAIGVYQYVDGLPLYRQVEML